MQPIRTRLGRQVEGDLPIHELSDEIPQPILVQMIRSGGIALGNLTLDTSHSSGFYPDIVMGYPDPLRQLRRMGVIESQGRFFCRNRGIALLVRKGNPLGIHGLADLVRTGARIALPDSGDVRAQCLAATEAQLGKPAANALVAAETNVPGRLGIMHRDLPEMVARGYADVAFTWYHLVSFWARVFPNHFNSSPFRAWSRSLQRAGLCPHRKSAAVRGCESVR
jgi:hypothetical protein